MVFHKTTLKNGIRIVTESQPSARSASFGIWLMQGTRDEAASDMGISHFVEHMVFKGTKTRSSFQIAKALEELGGDLNAYTTKENTCYHALVLKDHWEQALEVLCDLVNNMSISSNDFKLERSVILQEIAMSEDSLEELAYEHYFQQTLKGHPLSWPILGLPQTVGKITSSKIKSFYKTRYCGNRIVVAAAGNVNHQEVVKAVKRLLGDKPAGRRQSGHKKPKHIPQRITIEKQSEQLHIVLGLPVPSFKSSMRFEAFIVNALLGGGMTSKLYQKVRERKGLAYSIYSSLNTFLDFGLINIYAGCEPGSAKEVLRSIDSEIRRLRQKTVSKSELDLFKTQVKGSLLLGSDDVENRMSSIAVNEMVFEKYKPVEEVMDEIDAVTTTSVSKFIQEFIHPKKFGCVLLGKDAKKFQKFIETDVLT